MLQSSFLFVTGIGKNTEFKLWKEGIFTWDDYLSDPRQISGVPTPEIMIRSIREAQENIRSIHYFAQRIPRSEYWRLFPSFQNDCMYLDIETNGLHRENNSITAIGVMYQEKLNTFIRSRNLPEFKEYIDEPSAVITFNGIRFDVPFIEHELSVKIRQVHIDLMNVFRTLEIKGGLKKIENEMGISRGILSSLTGYDAVKLWNMYQYYSDDAALETLLAYNAEDVINLKSLMVKAYNMKLRELIEKNTAALENNMIPGRLSDWTAKWNSFILPEADLLPNPYKAHKSALAALAAAALRAEL